MKTDRVDFTLVTYANLPDLDPDDRLLVGELERRGATVRGAVWDDPTVDWASAGICVVRSTWDYDTRYDDFLRWIDRVSAVTRLVNPPELLRFSSDKTYLARLRDRGLPVVPTVFVHPGEPRTLRAVLEETGWRDVVVKPVVGLATSGVRRVRADEKAALADGEQHLVGLLARRAAMVQKYVPTVTTSGERALVFVGGSYSHAARKAAFQHLAVAGGAGESPIEPDADELETARRLIATVLPTPVYARVDLVRGTDGTPWIMELELVEPSLFLAMRPGAAGLLAEMLLR